MPGSQKVVRINVAITNTKSTPPTTGIAADSFSVKYGQLQKQVDRLNIKKNASNFIYNGNEGAWKFYEWIDLINRWRDFNSARMFSDVLEMKIRQNNDKSRIETTNVEWLSDLTKQ